MKEVLNKETMKYSGREFRRNDIALNIFAKFSKNVDKRRNQRYAKNSIEREG